MKKLGRMMMVGAVGAVLCAGVSQAETAAGFVVIVHADNPASSLSRSEVARMFLGRTTLWPDSEAVQPVDQRGAGPVRTSFTRTVLRKSSVAAVASEWRQLIFSGRGTPPPSVSGDAAVVQFVASHRGGVGYVAPNASLRGVKVVTVR